MEMITAYLAGALVLIGLWAVRVPHEDVRTVFLLAIMWPLTILSIVFMVILNTTGWGMNIVKGAKMFGFRRPTNPKVKGFAVTVLTAEIQFYKSA